MAISSLLWTGDVPTARKLMLAWAIGCVSCCPHTSCEVHLAMPISSACERDLGGETRLRVLASRVRCPGTQALRGQRTSRPDVGSTY
jgi:hypothetical protein